MISGDRLVRNARDETVGLPHGRVEWPVVFRNFLENRLA